MITFPTFPDRLSYTVSPWTDPVNGGLWLWNEDKLKWKPYEEPAASAWSDLTDKATANLPADNGPLATALAGKLSISTAASTYAPISTTVTLAGAQTITGVKRFPTIELTASTLSGQFGSIGNELSSDCFLNLPETAASYIAATDNTDGTISANTLTGTVPSAALGNAAPARRLLTGVGPHTAAIGDRITLDNTSTVARINDPTGTAAGQMYTVIIQRGTMWFNGAGQVFAASRLELVRAYNGTSWSTLPTVISDSLTTGGTVTFGTGTTFAFATGLDTGFRAALGLGALATVTPGTNVATALAINADATGGIFRQGGALSAASLSVTDGGVANFGNQRRLANDFGVFSIDSGNTNDFRDFRGRRYFCGLAGVAFGDGSSGVAEINNGTAGQYRDLQLRNLTASGTVTASGVVNVTASGTVANFTDSSSGRIWRFSSGNLSPLGNNQANLGASGARIAIGYFVGLDTTNLTASGTVKTGSYTAAAAIASSHATAIAAGDGAQTYISDTDKPAWSNGTVWKYADGTTVT